MAVQRKVFRIEEQVRSRAGASGGNAAHHDEFISELQTLRDLIEPRLGIRSGSLETARIQVAEAQAFKGQLALIKDAIAGSRGEMSKLCDTAAGFDATRLSRELSAIVTSTERATHAILEAAEDIDQAVRALAGELKDERGQELAGKIQGRVARIFEACHFQDLTGQHIANAVAALRLVETHVSRMLDRWQQIEELRPDAAASESQGDRRFLNGPRLAGEPGHSSQGDVDAIFG